jgi:1,4-dihydroxy-2-naphthoate octaprenyltransferase
MVGTALGYAVVGSFDWDLFILALLSMMALHSGANIVNDYYDHLSGNDWVNRNVTPFSGGRRFIQEGILSPRATLITALVFLAIGVGIGLVILWLTRSVFILGLGLAGLLGGFFYTAKPVQLGYRAAGEVVIALLFGLMPVYGAYYLQTGALDVIVLGPALVVSGLIFLVILINEFPDKDADARVRKQTLVVRLGIPAAVWIYRIVLLSSYGFAAVMLRSKTTFFAGLFYVLTLPLAVLALRATHTRDLITPGNVRANQLTVLMHALGAVSLTAGLMV